jgi:enoyl-CoA hydratase
MTVTVTVKAMKSENSDSPTAAAPAAGTVLVDKRDRVGLITLNRPKALNALNAQLAAEVLAAVRGFDADPGIGAIVVTGSPRAFAAGADIAEMAEKTYAELNARDLFADWDAMRVIGKPIIAAVSGYALGGGCELAMLCDLIIASRDQARHPARHRRQPAPHASRGQGAGDGHDPHRPQHRRAGSQGGRPGGSRGASRSVAADRA